jgi:integrase
VSLPQRRGRPSAARPFEVRQERWQVPDYLLGRHFNPLLRRAGLPTIRLHDLRHTCATILLMERKHPKYVQEFLGHANISITVDTYSHVIPGLGGDET